MALTMLDNKILQRWFTELQTLEKGSEAYLALRDRIYTYAYKKLQDMYRTKIGEWHRRYGLDEDDTTSIFSDTLLRVVEKFQPNRVKFITYFWRSCNNTAKNYYKKYGCQRRIPRNKILPFDLSVFNEKSDYLDMVDSEAQEIAEQNEQFSQLSDQLSELYNTEQYQQEMEQLVKDNIASLLPALSEVETDIFEKIVEGQSISNISKILQMRIQKVGFYVSRIRKKAMSLG